jgi:hypothetical protein
MVASLKKVVKVKPPVGKTLTSNNIILTSQIGNRQADPMGVGKRTDPVRHMTGWYMK